MKTEMLRLFNAIQVHSKCDHAIPEDVHRRTISHGYILDNSVRPDNDLLDTIEKIIGVSGEKANAAFHKSWATVRDSSMEALVMQQIIHYLTTYGFESMGIYSESSVYIPHEKLELPEITSDIPLAVVRGLTSEEILARIIDLGSGIALAQETLDDIMVIIKSNQYERAFIENIGNRELKALLYDHYGIIPSEPVEYLRHLVSKLTDESLLIKNEYLIDKIKSSNGKFLDMLLKDAPDNLAAVFYRYKPLFLAMKTISGNKAFFNRLRKKAVNLHAPLREDFLNSVTGRIKHNTLDLDHLARKLETATIFRKIRLANALSYRLGCENSIVYRIRNGKGWATDFSWDHGLNEHVRQAYDIVSASIAYDMRNNVEGKTFYIPAHVNYAVPATEKLFTGNLPTGSYVSIPEDLIVGIHWTNTRTRRIDLDLSVIGLSGKIGWDAGYRSKERDILFSGDVTDAPAPRGASELFYIRKGLPEPKILMANYYNFKADDPVDCKIMAACESPKKFSDNYVIDVNKMVATAGITMSRKQNILGLVININGENRVYFANVSIGNSITSSANPNSTHARNYLIASTVKSLSLGEVLRMAGATVVDTKPTGEFCDLSPEKLEKDTLVNIIAPLSSKAGC